MNRRYIFVAGTLVLWLLALAFTAKSAIDRFSVPSWGNPIGGDLSPEISGDTLIGQQFVAPLPGLYAIQVALDPTTASSPHEITFHLKTAPDAPADLWTSSFSTGDLQDGVPFAAEFEPLRDSQGQTYYFYFESANSIPGDAIAVHSGSTAFLEDASAYLNHQPADGNLQFHTLYSLRTREKLDLFLTRMASGRPYFWGTKGFYVGLAVIYVLVLTAFLWRVAEIVLNKQAEES